MYNLIEIQQVVSTVNLIKDQLGDITMLFHCCGLPSPRALIEEPPGIRATMDLSVISYFWVRIILINITRQNLESSTIDIIFVVIRCSFALYATCW